MTKYRDLFSVGTSARPQISECIRLKGIEEKSHYYYRAILFICQNDRKYNKILETELNLNDLEKITTIDER